MTSRDMDDLSRATGSRLGRSHVSQ